MFDTGVLREVNKRYGPWPRTYVVLDVETTGYLWDRDFILQIGHCRVENGIIAENDASFLNWALTDRLPHHRYDHLDYIRRQLDVVAASMAKKGESCKIDMPVLQAQGLEPLYVLKVYADQFDDWQKDKKPIVAYNGHRFDRRFWNGHLNALFPPARERFHPDLLWDVGVLINATQQQFYPGPLESLHDYLIRCGKARPGTKWNQAFAIRALGLDARYGIDPALLHNARYDSKATALLFEELGKMASATA
jgi:DNA polymerase III epsilon subunit-like protein